MNNTASTVFYCYDCKRAVVSTKDKESCPVCKESMKETGTFGRNNQ